MKYNEQYDITYDICDSNIKVYDSYKVFKKTFKPFLNELRFEYPNNTVLINYSNCALSNEWALHNFCYNFGWWKDRTKDVDLNYPKKWYILLVYAIFGSIARIFIK